MMTAPLIDPRLSINEIVELYPPTRAILHAKGLDLCCGGIHPLAMAARAHNVELEPLLAELHTACGLEPPATSGEPPAAAPAPEPEGPPITAEMTVRDCLNHYPGTRPLFEAHGMGGCGGPDGPPERIDYFTGMHSLDTDEFIGRLEEQRGLTLEQARQALDGPETTAPRPASTDKGLLRGLFKRK